MMLDHKMLAIAAAGVCALLSSSTASACSFRQRVLTSAQVRQIARDNFARATAVIDAEVVEPMRFGRDWKPGLVPMAYLKPVRVWKGQVPKDGVPVVYLNSCDIGLSNKGEKVRILLTGEGVFTADQFINGVAVRDLAAYQQEIDRLAGQRRLPILAHFPGDAPLPDKGRNVR